MSPINSAFSPNASQPLLEWLSPRALRDRGLSFDVLRMRVPGGWLVSTIVLTEFGRNQGVMSQTSVFVSDPEGSWSPRVYAPEEDARS